jgi:phage gp36-like protein
MAYTSPADVRGRISFGGSADQGSASGATDEQLLEAIEDARTEIDAVLAVRYPTPFDDPRYPSQIPIPPVVSRINRDMAAYLATLTYLRGAPLPENSPVALRYSNAQRLLRDIAKGAITLDLPAGPTDEQPTENVPGGASVVNPYEGTMFAPGQFGIGPALGPPRRVGGAFPSETY